MIVLLIGHRGAGKTTLMRQFQARHPEWRAHDLDEEIALATGESVATLFARGESEFRGHERRVLHDLISAATGPTVIALGAGFEGPPPPGAHVIWVRRETDSAGRVFLNRPRLDCQVSPYEEYMRRFPAREERYRAWAHEELMLPEGHAGELADFPGLGGGWSIPAALTLLPENFRDWESFWKRRSTWGLRHVEIRDDLLSEAQFELALSTLPEHVQLHSCRRKVPARARFWDWPVEAGAAPAPPPVLSLHARGENLEDTLISFSAQAAGIHKLAIEIHDWRELRLGHDWWLADPSRRAFLPRSANGRWRWYRSLFGSRMPLHFVREGGGSAADQPYVWQSVLQPEFAANFAAVLGDPVGHSRSPLEHRLHFAARGWPFVAVPVSESEFAEAMPVLTSLGLSAAAVTAPLKRRAAAWCARLTEPARALGAANTLLRADGQWHGHNTDVLALERLHRQGLEGLAPVWLWGGGGIKSSVKSVWPQAREISARAGTTAVENPKLLIWATGRSRTFAWPPPHVRPQLVLDLNYGDDSPGLEWALLHGFPYQSGLEMFKLQAEAQRAFWSAERRL